MCVGNNRVVSANHRREHREATVARNQDVRVSQRPESASSSAIPIMKHGNIMPPLRLSLKVVHHTLNLFIRAALSDYQHTQTSGGHRCDLFQQRMIR